MAFTKKKSISSTGAKSVKGKSSMAQKNKTGAKFVKAKKKTNKAVKGKVGAKASAKTTVKR